MEITPRELRDVEIAEAFRGYNREVVNDLLERAAATVDASNERVHELSERLKAAQLEADRSRETEDILHRTLLLAQRAADEAVAEAQQKARAMMEEAELESHKLLAEAQTEAQQRGDEERMRLESEVIDLAARRDTLLTDVDTLTQFETDYRDRLAAALEQDLEALRTRTTAAPGPVPEVEPVELPVAPEGIARSEPAAAFLPEPEPALEAAPVEDAPTEHELADDAPASFTAYTPGLDTDSSAPKRRATTRSRATTTTAPTPRATHRSPMRSRQGSRTPRRRRMRTVPAPQPTPTTARSRRAPPSRRTSKPRRSEPARTPNRPPGSPRSARPTPGSRMPATPVQTLRRRTRPGTSISRRARST